MLSEILASIGVEATLMPREPDSDKSWSIKGLWEIAIPVFDRAISKPRKNLGEPRSFKLNWECRNSLNAEASVVLLLAMIMSST